jgi:hypothetical protein
MNAIARLILRGVASGDVALTPQVLNALKNLNQVWSDTKHPVSGHKLSHCSKAKKSKQCQSQIRPITKL